MLRPTVLLVVAILAVGVVVLLVVLNVSVHMVKTIDMVVQVVALLLLR